MSPTDETLQSDPSKKVTYENTSMLDQSIPGIRSALNIERYTRDLKDTLLLISEWQAHVSNIKFFRGDVEYWEYLDHSAYRALINKGRCVVPVIMEHYGRDQSGWWHELLYEIKHGERSRSDIFNKAELFQEWSETFEQLTL